MIKKETYDEMKEEFGDVGSWGVWEPEGDNPTSNLDVLSIFNNPEILDTLHSNFVFVGINESGHGKVEGDHVENWSNFHSAYKYSKDYKIRTAFEDTVFWGSYMTDMIKHHFDPDSARVLNNKEKADAPENVNLFKRELEILGGKPILISFGGKVEVWLNKHFSDEYEILNLTHYSYRTDNNQEQYKQRCIDFIKQHNLNKRFK